MKKTVFVLLLVPSLVSLCLGVSLYERMAREERLVAVSWGDGKYGEAMYGAYVYLGNATDDAVEVKATIHIGRDTFFASQEYDLGVIGSAKDEVEAVKRWGRVTWKDDGVEFGGEAGRSYWLPRAAFESHR